MRGRARKELEFEVRTTMRRWLDGGPALAAFSSEIERYTEYDPTWDRDPVMKALCVVGRGYKRMSAFSRTKGSPGKAVDPIAEAEVYLACGRKEKAIAMLEAASRANPGDDDVRKRLLELKVGK